jgi:hypothetical protein
MDGTARSQVPDKGRRLPDAEGSGENTVTEKVVAGEA